MKTRIQSAIKDDPKAKIPDPKTINSEWEKDKSKFDESSGKVGRPAIMKAKVKAMVAEKDETKAKQAVKGTPPAKGIQTADKDDRGECGNHTCPKCGSKF